jgi:hypothetical protein
MRTLFTMAILLGLAAPAAAQTADRLYVMDCGHNSAKDQSRWSPGVNVGKPIELSDMCDALRALHPGERIYTYWKYFRNAFARDAGLRIDHLLLSPSLPAASLPPASTARCGPAKSRAITRPSGSNLRTQRPARGIGRGAHGGIDSGDAFFHASRAGGPCI